jgi:DNA-binding HxlR family transcriptional regulator
MSLRTAQQRKDICSCPVARVADRLGDSCTLLIIRDLMAGPKRYRDLSDSLAGISSRTLSKKLKCLEDDGIIERAEYAEHPPRAEYRLTKKGAALHGVVDAMRSYGKKYL